MKKISLTLFVFTVFFSSAQVANDDCSGALDYGILDGRMNFGCMNGVNVDTSITVTNLNAIPNFPFYYSNNFCGSANQDTVYGVHNDVWYKVRPSAFFKMICLATFPFQPDTARITFWTDDGNGCGNFLGGTTLLIPLTSGGYQNIFSASSTSNLYFQISGNNPTNTINFTMCLHGFGLHNGIVCNLIGSSPYDSLCFVTTLAQSNPSSFSSSDGEISVSVSHGIPPYNFLWNTGDTTSYVSGLSIGNYSVTITDSTNCSNSYPINLTAPTLNSETAIDAHSLISPNPTTQQFNINISGKKSIYIYDCTGNLCKSVLTDGMVIDVSYLPPGLYLIRIESSIFKFPITHKLLIEASR